MRCTPDPTVSLHRHRFRFCEAALVAVLALLAVLCGAPVAAAEESTPAPTPAPAPAPSPVPRPDGARLWPLAGRPAVVRGWEPPASTYGRGHRGVDLATEPGTAVLAAASGRVSFAGRVAGRGVVAIEVAGTGDPPLRTTYEPVRALVTKDERVTAGQVVAVVEAGPFHCASGCLHWGLRRADAYLDPLSLLPPELLRRGPSRLLPVFGVPESRPSTEGTTEGTGDGLAAPGALFGGGAGAAHPGAKFTAPPPPAPRRPPGP
ncbi:murein hydrolase activator EnvC family protein, partial [Streptomyces sp. NPDC057557]|uniref:murein hydrolase activator EnvC family protein n=1 Tax=Streptomyces sp. NPDC057557 TaxID=3346167 RepID=UPI003683360D